jgi:hypothetical protein
LITSGSQALAFVWQGDSLWTKTVEFEKSDWTTFVLPAREGDSIELPSGRSLQELGEFLVASLTFTQALKQVRVFVQDEEKLTIVKTLVQPPRPVATKTSNGSSWWKLSSGNNSTPSGFFSVQGNDAIQETVYRMTVMLQDTSASLDLRFVSAGKQLIPLSWSFSFLSNTISCIQSLLHLFLAALSSAWSASRRSSRLPKSLSSFC